MIRLARLRRLPAHVLGPGAVANARAGCDVLRGLRAEREDVELFLAAHWQARLTPPDAA